jgi:hypothetical protein
MIETKCLNCGANLDISTPEDYIKCSYCGSVLANYGSFKNLQQRLADSSSPDDLSQMAQLLLVKDYEGLQQLAEKVLKSNPLSVVAMVYRAIAFFWLGYDNFSHLDEILTILNKAQTLSDNNEIVVRAREAICNDIVVLAAKNEIYGDDLVVSLRALKIASQMSALKKESQEALKSYCTKAFERYKANLEELVLKQKKDYDPPSQSIMNLLDMVDYFETDQGKLEFIYLHSEYHLSKNKSKSYHEKLSMKLGSVAKLLEKMRSDVKDKRLTFNFLGKLTVK